MSTGYKKCAVTNDPKTCALCSMMEKYCDPPNPKGKGLKEYILTDINTGLKRWAFIAFHSSAKDRGTVINFCPWCGEKVLPVQEMPVEAKP